MSGIVKLVHRVDDPDGPFMIVSEVAEYFECHPDTIRRWSKHLGLPNHKMLLGEDDKPDDERGFVWLYTQDDIGRLERYQQSITMGRPKSEDKEGGD